MVPCIPLLRPTDDVTPSRLHGQFYKVTMYVARIQSHSANKVNSHLTKSVYAVCTVFRQAMHFQIYDLRGAKACTEMG